MAADSPTQLREAPAGITTAQRFDRIQNEMAQLLDGVDVTIRQHIHALITECDAAQGYPLPPGQKENYRQISAVLKATVERLNAPGSRR